MICLNPRVVGCLLRWYRGLAQPVPRARYIPGTAKSPEMWGRDGRKSPGARRRLINTAETETCHHTGDTSMLRASNSLGGPMLVISNRATGWHYCLARRSCTRPTSRNRHDEMSPRSNGFRVLMNWVGLRLFITGNFSCTPGTRTIASAQSSRQASLPATKVYFIPRKQSLYRVKAALEHP
jgi:hypothetical protein